MSFGERDFNMLETSFVEDRESTYILKARKVHTYKDNFLSESKRSEFYVIVYKYINRVDLYDSENILIYSGLN